MSEQYFTPEMTVDEAFRLHAGARRVFARFHLGGCSNCAISESHTIGAISVDYGIPLPMLLDSLNALFDQKPLAIGDAVRIPGRDSREDSAARQRARCRRDHRCRKRRLYGRLRRRSLAGAGRRLHRGRSRRPPQARALPERLAVSEALFDSVPVLDARFPQLPA